MTKFTIIRVTGEGEQITAEVQVPDKYALAGAANVHNFLKNAIYEPLDTRLRESAQRLLDAMGFERQVPENIRHGSMLITKQVLDLIYGRTQAMMPVPQEAIDADKAAIEAEKLKLGERAELPKDNVIVGPWSDTTVEQEDEDDGGGESA